MAVSVEGCAKEAPEPDAGERAQEGTRLERLQATKEVLVDSKAESRLAWRQCQSACLSTVETSAIGTIDGLCKAQEA